MTKDKTIIGKLEIQINEMKSIIKYLLPTNIFNIKRKILDIIYENYCPNKSFLDKRQDYLYKNKKLKIKK